MPEYYKVPEKKEKPLEVLVKWNLLIAIVLGCVIGIGIGFWIVRRLI